MGFQFQYKLGRDDFIALNSMINQTEYGRRRKWLKRVFALLGVVLTGIGLMYIQQKSYPAGAFITVIGLYFLVRIYTMGRLGKRQADRLAAGVTGERHVTLEDAGIRIRDSRSEALAPYGGVQSLLYLDQRYFLIFDRRRILLLPLTAMTGGDPAALRPFLEEKLGLETKDLT